MKKEYNPTLIVFYDSWCKLCQNIKTKIEKADKNNKILFLSFRNKTNYEKFKLEGKNVEERIYSLNPHTNKHYSGIWTILELAKLIPKYRIVVPFLYMSILLGLGQKVYDFIAARRSVVPIGHCEESSCMIESKDMQGG